MKLGRCTMHETWRMLQGRAHLRYWLRAGMLLFTIGFLIFLVMRGREELRQFENWRAYLSVGGQGLLLYPVSLIVQAAVWGMMIARLGQVTTGWRDVEIYAYTHLMRRLPGAMWYLVGRTVEYQERGIRASVTLAASGLEWLLLILVALSLFSALNLSGPGSWLLALVLLALFVLVISSALKALPAVRSQRWVPNFARNWLANLSAARMPKSKDLALWVILYAVAYVIGGAILFLLTRGVAPQSDITLPDAIRIWALGGGIGLLVSTIVPAGLGIRELTLTALLSPYVPTVGALLVAVLLRMLFIVGDLIWGGLLWAAARLLGHNQSEPV